MKNIDNRGYKPYNKKEYCKSFIFFMFGQKIIITNGFIKKTQKTPKREIKLAKKYRNDYLKRKGEKE